MNCLSGHTIIIWCSAVILTTSLAMAQPDINFRNAKTLGMGNARVAGGFTYNGFINNPALLTRVQRVKFCMVRLPVTINDHIYDFANFINSNADQIIQYGTLNRQEKKDLLDEIIGREGKWGRVFFSPMVDMAITVHGHSIGVAGYATNRFALKMDRGIYEPRIFGTGISTLALVLGYARTLFLYQRQISLGVNVKLLQNRSTKAFHIRARDLGNIVETVKPIYDEYRKKKDNMIGIDLGALWEIPSQKASIGVTTQYLGMGRYASVDIGISKLMLRKKLLLSADYFDLLDNNKENVFNKIHAGLEYRYTVVVFRGGINSGYPTAGIGLNLKIIDIDVAYYTEELSKTPGLRGDSRYIAQLKIGW